MSARLYVFLKAPMAGRVKTRLGRTIGMGRAACLFRHMSAHTIAQAVKGEWSAQLAIDPPAALHGWNAIWPPDIERVPQAGGDLGARMAAVFETAPPGPVVIIGADAPGMRARMIRKAFFALRGADAVFGPAADGGYWLIGLARRRRAPELFSGVRWSSEHALADTAASMPVNFRIEYLETLRDVDQPADLAAFGLRSTAR